jgi:hypothetical protein
MESSYECVEYDWRDCIRTEYNNKWESAVNGAITFAKTLSNKINGAKIALVGFSGDNGIAMKRPLFSFNASSILILFFFKNLVYLNNINKEYNTITITYK